MTLISTPSLVVCSLVVWMVTRLLKIGRREECLPPGPPTLPFIGNAHLMPTKFAHIKFTEWAQQYGPIFSLKIARGTFIVLSDVTVVKELLDQRSAVTSGRPPLHMADLITDKLHVSVSDSSTDIWRIGRKALQNLLSPQAINSHAAVANAEGHQLLFDLLSSPKDFLRHIDRYTYSTMSSVAFGKRCPQYDNCEARVFFKALRLLSTVVSAEAPPVDLIPVLEYVPERWAPWKETCRKVRTLQRRLYFGLLEETEARLTSGNATGCFMEDVLERREELGMSRDAAAYLGGVVLEGGAESSASLLSSLILAFVAFPETLKQAQNEIDYVLSDGRPPTMDDAASLPYIRAVLREIHRFRPMGPSGLPHALLQTQKYRDFVIPKSATVIINVWGIMHDPKVFEDPEIFRPERFLLNEHGTKPGVENQDWRASLPFGSGRRLCPGMNLANTNLTLTIALLVWAFNFTHSIDPVTNKPIPVDIQAYNTGLFFNPLPFACMISPRSREKADLIKQMYINATSAFLKYEEVIADEDKRLLAEHRNSLGL